VFPRGQQLAGSGQLAYVRIQDQSNASKIINKLSEVHKNTNGDDVE